MNAREVARRTGIWAAALLLLAAGIGLAALGRPVLLLESAALIVIGAYIRTVRPGNVIGVVATVVPLTIVLDQTLGVQGLAATVPAWIETIGDMFNALGIFLLPAYAIVTLLTVCVYALVVVSITWLLPGLPSVGVALATLIAAALFLPVLRAVQRVVDRRFDRERYNAEKVVDAFGERLRSHLDPHSRGGDLTTAVEQTLQPASVGIWTVEKTR